MRHRLLQALTDALHNVSDPEQVVPLALRVAGAIPRSRRSFEPSVPKLPTCVVGPQPSAARRGSSRPHAAEASRKLRRRTQCS
jgi:hypothetical protein